MCRMLPWYLRVFDVPLPIVRDARDRSMLTAGECLDLVRLNVRHWGAISGGVGARGREQDDGTSEHETCVPAVTHPAGRTIL